MLKTLSITEISFYISNIFEAEELLQNIKIFGEVSNLSFVRGNLYFNLKDENATLPCIMFGTTSNQIKEGDQILATGSLKYYPKGGKLNFYATAVSPYGSGILYQKFLELKLKLEEEGIFGSKFKKELPKTINTIGVVTSQTGAVLQDIITVSQRRNPCLNIIVYPARVQGIGAEKTLVDGLKYFDKQKDIDVVIIARGGGSIEDLQPFNTEILAREIVKCSKPVISAVGHETDVTICDLASSLRAATPSVAAELVSKDLNVDVEKIKSEIKKIYFLSSHLFDSKYEKLDNLTDKLSNNILRQNNVAFTKFEKIISNFDKDIENFESKKEQNFIILTNKLDMLNPGNLLEKGFVRVRKKDTTIKNLSNLKIGDDLEIEFLDGNVESKVFNIKEKKL